MTPETLIASALRSQHLEHAFQPVWDLEEGTLLGFEALARFPGEVPPDPVWAAARHCGTLWMDLDRLSIREAVRQARELPGVLFVNACGRYLGSLKPPRGTVTRAIARDRPGRGTVVVEVTEDALAGFHRAREGAERFRHAGVPLALDDAGSGCAQALRLALLQPYLAYVKLDRHVVQGWLQDGRGPLETWLRWARGYRLPVVAEGIEAPEAVMRLRQAGVRFGQGFHLGRPQRATAWTLPALAEAARALAAPCAPVAAGPGV